MRIPIPPVSALFVAAGAMVALHAQITSNPIPAPVEKRGLAVEIREIVRLPDTRGLRPLAEDVNPAGWARVSFVRDAPDGRRFANDSRGRLYLLEGGKQPPERAAELALGVGEGLDLGRIGRASCRERV